MENKGLLDKEIDTKTIKGMAIEKLITAICWCVCFLLIWQFSTAYKLDFKIDNHIAQTTDKFIKEEEAYNLAINNSHNETIKREADILGKLQTISTEYAAKEADLLIRIQALSHADIKPPIISTPNIGNTSTNTSIPNPSQTPLEYERQFRKEWKK